MAKEINEKTFELNITNELLNLSKSFIWYLNHVHWFHFASMGNRDIISKFIQEATLFAEGLTQEQESNTLTGGYDVSINYKHPNGQEGRILFLQYKSGIRKLYSNKTESKFNKKNANSKNTNPEHILFTFNDAAKRTQHSTLRKLANRVGIQPESVIYVFPRITEKTEFTNKIGNLVINSSFVPVIEIDKQASSQIPPITIVDGVSHNYRTSYDGLISEVNFFFFPFNYDNKIISELLSELICIQIERFLKLVTKENQFDLEKFTEVLLFSLNRYIEYELKIFPSKDLLLINVDSYINSVLKNYNSDKQVPQAPSKYTSVLPREGLKLSFDEKNDFSLISYQIF